LINEITGSTTSVELRPVRNWDRLGKRYGATEKSREKLEFEEEADIRAGQEKTIKWTIKNKTTVLDSIGKHRFFVPEVGNYKL
jgi:UDP-glucose 4-epimerase